MSEAGMEKKVTPLGDLHFGKRTVLVETEGDKYIKKPRSSNTEKAFDKFCVAVAELGFCAFSRAPLVIDSYNDYHIQAIEKNICIKEEKVSLYYYRAGILLFFSYLFSATDLHCENIIAAGDMPVLLDLETLMSGKKSRESKNYNLGRSVMCSHLLCNFAEIEGKIMDVSGFTGRSAQEKNIPITSSGRKYLHENEGSFICGFKDAYNLCSSHEKEIEKLLHYFDGCSFRQILRPTATYERISEYLFTLEEKEREEKAYDLLSRAYKRDLDKNRCEDMKNVISEEVRSVLHGEIPLFHTKGNGRDLLLLDKTVFRDFLEISPVNYAIDRLRSLSCADLSAQCKIIKTAILASAPRGSNKAIAFNMDSLLPGEICGRIVSESAIWKLPGVFCELGTYSSGVALTSVGFSLYSGLSGIMCMYAALYRKTGRMGYRDMLYRCYERFMGVICENNHKILLKKDNASLGDGIIGMISCLLHIGELTEDGIFADTAKSLFGRIDFSGNFKDADYLKGVGALPLIMYKCGVKENRELLKSLYEIFEEAEILNTGAAHGVSGLMLSLAAIDAMTGEDRFTEKICQMIKWEDSKYSEENNNWYDLRDANKNGFMSGWCSGAPGIGMARHKLTELTSNGDLRRLCQKDIERSANFLMQESRCRRDSLCCGTASRLMAASRLGIKNDGMYEFLAEAEGKNSLRLYHGADTSDVLLSLMQGISGIAYGLAMYGDEMSGGMLI